ncbi:MAG TPA: RNA ligase family protein [Candidatus Omnitrophota bacterium]|nr:RNA ligase family protein [Candidatus Omnitrophota bacterium]
MEDNLFVKYKRIPHLDEVPHILNNPVKVYEKIDGGNAQIRKIKGRVICGSRAHFLTREEFFSQDWFKDFQKWALKDYRFYDLPENLIVYGEWTSKHVLNYRPDFTDKFFLLDVFDLDAKRFVPYNEGRDRLLGLKIEGPLYLRTLFSGKIKTEQLEKMVEKSDYRDGNMEGVVIKNYDLQEFAKLWTSTIKRKGIITQSDVKSIFLSLADEGETVTKSKLLRQLESDLRRSNRNVSQKEIQDAVEKFYLSLI